MCDYVIEELRLVTDRKFPIVRDPKDSPILATAILENVDVLVTGDKDFLVLDVEIPDIVNMTEFMERYKIYHANFHLTETLINKEIECFPNH